MTILYYREGFSRVVAQDFEIVVPELAGFSFQHKFFSLDELGLMKFKDGYAWDGDTYGPDTKASTIASLVHDGACQARNESLIPDELGDEFRAKADLSYFRLCVEHGMSVPRARARYHLISLFRTWTGKNDPSPILVAP